MLSTLFNKKQDMKTYVVDLSPTLAKTFLESNKINRRIRKTHYKNIAKSITRGEWKLTHQGLAFDSDGNMIDGQHRCLAVIESGLTVPIMVSTCVDPSAFIAIDCGVVRTASDLTKLDKRVTELTAFMLRSIFKVQKPSAQQNLDIYNEFKTEIDLVDSFCKKKSKTFSTSSWRAAGLIHVLNGDGDYALNALRDLTLANIENLNGILASAMKSAVLGKLKLVNDDRTALLKKAIFILDPANKDERKIKPVDDETYVKLLSLVDNKRLKV